MGQDTDRASLHRILDRVSGRRIVVLGDVALDRFVEGRTERISREAPVLVLRYRGEQCEPGCGGNAARNLAALQADVRLVGVRGDDPEGALLEASLRERGVDTTTLLRIPGARTWAKTRFLAGDLHTVRQQVMRLDHEPDRERLETRREALHEAFEHLLEDADAVLLCDYGGGVLDDPTRSEAIAAAQRRGLVIVADSRYRLQAFAGVTCATPNETEIEPLVGERLEDDAAVERAGILLQRRLEAPSLVVTRGRLGMTVFAGETATHLPAFGADAVDVAGAGDTVAATLTLALASGADVLAAARLANYAASQVVQQRGTAATTLEAIRACIEADGGLA